MALVPFLNFAADVAPHVEGCPSAVIAATIRKMFIDLCQRGKIWRVPLTSVTLSSGTYAYALASPIAETEVSAILNAQWYKATTSTVINNLEITTSEVINSMYPDWPNTAVTGEPRALFQAAPSAFNIAPVPGSIDTYTVKLTAAIRPTTTAVNVEDSLMNEFRREWFHGALCELMTMPNRVWSNDKLANYHGKQWTYLLSSARARANKGFGRTAINVRPRPWA